MNFLLYGVPLAGLIVAAIKVFQAKLGMSDETAEWLRAGLFGGAFLLVVNADAIQAAWPLFQTVVVQAGGFLSIILGSLGFWPEIQAVGRRIVGK